MRARGVAGGRAPGGGGGRRRGDGGRAVRQTGAVTSALPPTPSPERTRVRRIAVLGTVVVAAYAAFGALHALVLNPLAAVPGRSLAQIHDDVAAAGESLGWRVVTVILGLGVLAAVALLRALWRSRQATARGALLGYLTLLVAGGPAFFWASFAPGVALADTYGIGGGSHCPADVVLYAVSAAALATLAVMWLRGRNQPAR